MSPNWTVGVMDWYSLSIEWAEKDIQWSWNCEKCTACEAQALEFNRVWVRYLPITTPMPTWWDKAILDICLCACMCMHNSVLKLIKEYRCKLLLWGHVSEYTLVTKIKLHVCIIYRDYLCICIYTHYILCFDFVIVCPQICLLVHTWWGQKSSPIP